MSISYPVIQTTLPVLLHFPSGVVQKESHSYGGVWFVSWTKVKVVCALHMYLFKGICMCVYIYMHICYISTVIYIYI